VHYLLISLWRAVVVTIDDLWPQCRLSIENKVNRGAWLGGLNTLSLVDYSDDTVVLGVATAAQYARIADRHFDVLQESVQEFFGSGTTLRLEIDEFAHDVPRPAPTQPAPAMPSVPRPVTTHSTGRDRSTRLDPKMTFESFIPGQSTRLAFAAAQTVAETPGQAYNPLMIYGPSGLGKTHLLHAIGNYVNVHYPERSVVYVSTETFLNDFIEAIQSKSTLALHKRYRECDVLLIDDIQFMESRKGTFHDEIFHTYNALHSEGKQVVLTSDRSPRDLAGLEDRFRTRLLQGLITEVDQPDLQTRVAIIRSKAAADNIVLPDDVVEFIAHRVRDNIRELEGSITMLRAYAGLRQEKISLELAQSTLSNIGQEHVVLLPDNIIAAVAEFYGFSSTDIKGPNRSRPLVTARHVAMFLMRELLPDYSYPMIARVFGDRNHTTVISGVEKIRGQLPNDQVLFTQVTQLKRRLQSSTE
jgi:chromosomal replication initiator protein